jgi:hypothetical protein
MAGVGGQTTPAIFIAGRDPKARLRFSRAEIGTGNDR